MAYANLSGAEVIREIVLKNRLLQPKIPVLDQKTSGKLKRIGTSINQIAKKLSSGKKFLKWKSHWNSFQANWILS